MKPIGTGFRIAQLTGVVGALLAVSTVLAVASPTRVIANTNLRLGPGTQFGVAATIPAGSIVEISNCSGQWCSAQWRGRIGYMISTNLDLGGPRPVVGGPRIVVYDEPPVYVGRPYYYGPRYGYPGPGYRSWRRW